MSSRARLTVLLISAPLVLVLVVGGFLSKAVAREDSFDHLRVFEDVVSLILNNYVEDVKSDRIMHGAMEGLADGLDPDSAYLTPAEVARLQKQEPAPAGSIGVELTRQYYLRVIAARDGSPAAKAGLRTGDFIRSIDDKPTREMSVMEGSRLLIGAPGTHVKLTVIRGNAAEPHTVDVVREAPAPIKIETHAARPGVEVLRVPAFTPQTASDLKQAIGSAVGQQHATHVILDLRGTAEGALDDGLAAARLFVGKGTLAAKETREGTTKIEAQPGDGSITVPVTLLVDNGTSGAAELFASALSGNGRAQLVGEHTLGRAATQELIKLPDGSALWLSTGRYLTPKNAVLHEKGLTPDVAVEEPDVEFGAAAPQGDPILDKALETISASTSEHKQAA